MEKKINPVTIVLAVAIVVLFILHFTNKKAVAPVAEVSESSAAVAVGDIAYVQIDSLLNLYDMFHDLRSQYENKAQTIQNDLGKRGRSLESDVEEFQKKVQKGLLTRAQVESQQQQLAQREHELQNFVQQKQMELAEEEEVILRRVFDALEQYIEKLNSEKRYSLIISTSGTPGAILYGDSALNITHQVAEGMNDDYIKERGKKKSN